MVNYYYRPSAVLDLTGEEMAVYTDGGSEYDQTASVPFHVILKPEANGKESPEHRQFYKNQLEEDDTFSLHQFHHIMPLIAGENELLETIWRFFFKKNNQIFSRLRLPIPMVCLVPMAWEPQASQAIIRALATVLPGCVVEMCTEAFALFFRKLFESQRLIQIIDLPETDSIAVTIKTSSDTGNAFRFSVTKRPNRLEARLVGWQALSDTDSLDLPNHSQHTPAASGYFYFQEYINRRDMPRVDFNMETTIGLIAGENDFFPLLVPSDLPGKSMVQVFDILDDARHVDVPLACWFKDKGRFFPMARFTASLDENGINRQNPCNLQLNIQKVNYGLAKARFALVNQEPVVAHVVEFPLPRLYH